VCACVGDVCLVSQSPAYYLPGKTELPGIVTEFLSTQPLYGWICKQKSLTGKKYDKENFLTDRYYTKKTDELKNY